MQTIIVTSKHKDEVLDLTDDVQAFLRGAEREDGVCVVFAAHTTCAVTIADLDPGTDEDLLQALRAMLPKQRYRHPHDPSHAQDHLLAAIVGPSVAVPYARRRLLLGTWQRVVLVELDGPRERAVHLSSM